MTALGDDDRFLAAFERATLREAIAVCRRCAAAAGSAETAELYDRIARALLSIMPARPAAVLLSPPEVSRS